MRLETLYFSLVGAALAASLTAPAVAAERCATCHPDAKVAAAESVHTDEGVSCSSCHGGDPESLDSDAAHGGDFRNLRERLDIPNLCGGCHGDLEQMRPYNLPIDQYAVYQTSQHGRAIARGERRAAVCTDCHGVHGIRAPHDPGSPVYRRNVPETCGQCHANAGLMDSFDIDANVIEDYRKSVHGHALLEAGNLAAPSCTNCHGVHGATPPGFGDLDKVCGSCHVETRMAFLAGPHYELMIAAEMPECVSCHSHHEIRRFDDAAIGPLCAECHGEGSDQARTGDKIRTLLEGARHEVEEAESLVEKAKRIPIDIQGAEGRIEDARTHLTEALPLVHTVSVEAVERVTRRARSIGEEVQHDLYTEMATGSKRLGLALFWFYLIMTLAILVGIRRRLQ